MSAATRPEIPPKSGIIEPACRRVTKASNTLPLAAEQPKKFNAKRINRMSLTELRVVNTLAENTFVLFQTAWPMKGVFGHIKIFASRPIFEGHPEV
jgi:hypothetical protein